MRLRDIEKFVKDQLTSGGSGGIPNPLNRVNRKTTSDVLNPQNNDQAVLDMLALPNGTTFIATKFPDKDVYVEAEVMLTGDAAGYADCVPMIHDPSDEAGTTQTLDKAYLSGATGVFIFALSFYVPAGWEYTLQMETDGSSAAAFNLQHLHETPLS